MSTIIQQMGIDAKLLYEAMDKLSVDESISYTEISVLIKRDITKHRSIIESARRAHLRNGKVFCTVRNVGLQRINDEKKIDVAVDGFRRIGSVARRTRKMLEAVQDFNALPNEAKSKHNAAMSMCGAIALFSKPSALKKVESVIKVSNGTLPTDETLQLFRG